MSIVRENLMTREGYSPYCPNCSTMARTRFNGNQFECICGCGWVSEFPEDFIETYKAKWSNTCTYCCDEPEPGRIEIPDNGPIVDCPVCNWTEPLDGSTRRETVPSSSETPDQENGK